MEKYRIVIEPAAVNDLRDIAAYITETLKDPASARRVYLSIKKSFSALENMPYRQKNVNDEKFSRLGLRRLPAENYSEFYLVSEETHTVHIVRILYNRREWQYLL